MEKCIDTMNKRAYNKYTNYNREIYNWSGSIT